MSTTYLAKVYISDGTKRAAIARVLESFVSSAGGIMLLRYAEPSVGYLLRFHLSLGNPLYGPTLDAGRRKLTGPVGEELIAQLRGAIGSEPTIDVSLLDEDSAAWCERVESEGRVQRAPVRRRRVSRRSTLRVLQGGRT